MAVGELRAGEGVRRARRAGAVGFLAIVAFHLPQMLLSALGWAGAIAQGRGPPLRTYLLLRWVREAVNNLLPLARSVSEFVMARLLQRHGVRLAQAIGGTIRGSPVGNGHAGSIHRARGRAIGAQRGP